MKRIIENEKGAIIVEASIVFPIMLFVICILMYLGNALYIMAQIDSIVTQGAVKGAAHCADPLLNDVYTSGVPISAKDIDVKPYAVIFGHGDIESAIKSDIESKISSVGTGLFNGMTPICETPKVKFNNYLVCSNFEVSVKYQIKIPLALPGEDYFVAKWEAKHVQPVNDATNFIRDIDMVDDYMEQSGAKQWIADKFGKAKQFFENLTGGTD